MATKFRFFEKTVDRSVYQNMVKTEEYKDLKTCLVQMQTERGVDAAEAYQAAEACIAAVLEPKTCPES